MSNEKIKIFVYGTLRKGCYNYDRMGLEKADFIGEDFVKHVDLYDVGNFPCIVEGKGMVKGEIYEVDSDMLRKIDMLEGYNVNTDDGMYLRRNTITDNGVEVGVYYWNAKRNNVNRLKNLTELGITDWIQFKMTTATR